MTTLLETVRTYFATRRQIRKREADLNRELARVRKSMERLLTAYQEDLLSLDELRRRMPSLRQREQSLQGELQALRDRTAEEAAMLRLSETLASFLKRLRETAGTLDITGRQKILRLLVKEVLVDKDSITIRHSIPIPRDPDDAGGVEDATLGRSSPASPGYLLRSGRDCGTASQGVHSRYQRHSADLPTLEHQIRIRLVIRRFYCCNSPCPGWPLLNQWEL